MIPRTICTLAAAALVSGCALHRAAPAAPPAPSASSTRVLGHDAAVLPLASRPLFVVDGVVQPRKDSGNAIPDVSPDRIDRIEVLKGVAATSLYGTDGANGVILVYTKHPAPTPSASR
jgi:TonB-dependent SusC/RagA subfamily outer membrane receptor